MTKNNDEQLNEIEKDIKKYNKIVNLFKTEGGEELVEGLGKDIVSVIEELCHKYKTSGHIEIIALIAKLSEKLAMYRIFVRSNGQQKGAKIAYENRLKELLN